MHPAGTHHEIWTGEVRRNDLREFAIIFHPCLPYSLLGIIFILFVFDEVVVVSADPRLLGASEAVSVLAVRDDVGDVCVGEGGGAAGVDEGL
jgi:hypothetical protein